MFDKIKSLMSKSAESLADNADNFNNTLRLQQLYQNYGALSGNRFANNRDYQKQLKCMGVSYGGLNLILKVINKCLHNDD